MNVLKLQKKTAAAEVGQAAFSERTVVRGLGGAQSGSGSLANFPATFMTNGFYS